MDICYTDQIGIVYAYLRNIPIHHKNGKNRLFEQFNELAGWLSQDIMKVTLPSKEYNSVFAVFKNNLED